MALKQQQASVAQAWQAVQQADETVKQGRAIMVFTLITIVFVRVDPEARRPSVANSAAPPVFHV